jgi:hypothetical protein
MQCPLVGPVVVPLSRALRRAGFQTREEGAATVNEFETVSQNLPRSDLLQYADEISLSFHFPSFHDNDSAR